MSRSLVFALFSIAVASSSFMSGCGSPAPAGTVGGPVADAADQHCIVNGVLTPTTVGMCMADNGGADAGAVDDGGADAMPTNPYGETQYNSSGYDDDCKYHVSFTSTPVRRNAGVTFTVTVERLDPAGVASGAAVYPEIYLTPTQPALSMGTTNEVPLGSGIYEIGPVVFQYPGLWTVRFHMYETCSDAPEDSPHGHIAFYIDVP
jgi:hypothetical protein